MKACPNLYIDHHVSKLHTLFLYWRASNCTVWPDGRPAIEQPKRLMDAFNFLLRYTAMYEKIAADYERPNK